jgi:DNA-binding transcriptional ArsR family regulator
VALTDDITDPRLAKALAHPLRLQILRALDGRTASPSEIATELGAPLTNVSYHVRKLRSLGLIKLVRKTPKRGVVEHYYSAPSRAKVSDEAWAETPGIVKSALVEASARQAASFMVQAAASGGFDLDEAHFSRTNLTLDARGWKQVAKVFEKALLEVEKIEAQTSERMDGTPPEKRITAAAMLLLFQAAPQEDQPEAPATTKRSSRRSTRSRATA